PARRGLQSLSTDTPATIRPVRGLDSSGRAARPPPSIAFFLFEGSRDHRDLHSFPTRRSSDLKRLLETDPPLVPYRRADPAGSARSEEHTSELQSRFDLVCRLLLEKKKRPTDGRRSWPRAQPQPLRSRFRRSAPRPPTARLAAG